MARKSLSIDPSRAEWRCIGTRTDSYPSRALTAILVGGHVTYGNVSKLPDLLWNTFGVAVTTHAVAAKDVRGPYDLCIALVDQTSHPLKDAAKSVSRARIDCPSTWSKMRVALEGIGLHPFDSGNFEEPTPAAPPTLPKPRRTPMASRTKAPPRTKKPPLSEELQTLLSELKAQLIADNIEHMEIEVSHSDGTMTVHSRRIVVVEDIASF